MKIKKEKLDEFFGATKELEMLLTERISDCHEVKGMMQCRHAYILYRELLWKARGIIQDNIKE